MRFHATRSRSMYNTTNRWIGIKFDLLDFQLAEKFPRACIFPQNFSTNWKLCRSNFAPIILFCLKWRETAIQLLIRKKCWSRFNSKTRNTSYRHGMEHIIMGFGGRVDIVLKLNRTEAYSGIYRVLRGVVPLTGFRWRYKCLGERGQRVSG